MICFVLAFSNRTFTFQIKTPTTSWLIKRCAKIDKGSARYAALAPPPLFLYPSLILCLNRPGHDKVGKIHVKQIYEIAKVKQRDEHLKELSLISLCRCVVGSAQSM